MGELKERVCLRCAILSLSPGLSRSHILFIIAIATTLYGILIHVGGKFGVHGMRNRWLLLGERRGRGFSNVCIVWIRIVVNLVVLIKDILLFGVSRHIQLMGGVRSTGGELLNSSVLDTFV